MKLKTDSLRFRVLLALVLIVSVTSFLFAGGVLIIKTQLEAVIFGEMAERQFDKAIITSPICSWVGSSISTMGSPMCPSRSRF